MATLTGIAVGDPNFSILVATLGFIDDNIPGSDLVGTLDAADADLTVFAPTNAAFGVLAADLGYDGDQDDADAVTAFLTANVAVETLNAIVTYHVSAGAQSAADIDAADMVSTLQGGTIGATELPTLTDAEPDLLNPTLTTTDVAADNGILHVIDRVLLPVDLDGNDAPTITGIVAASGDAFDDDGDDFDVLLAAVQAAGLAGTLDDPTADFTVFAPTDDAFVSLAQNLGYGGDDEGGAFGFIVDGLTLLGGGDPIPLLADVLLYHVAPVSLQSAQVLALDEIGTVQGGTVERDGTTLIDADPELPDPSLVALDIQAANGIVHAIDEVLIPVDLLASDGSDDVDFVIGDDGFSFVRTGRDDDFVDARGGSDIVLGGRGRDVVLGGDGADALFGMRGNDTLDGGDGTDLLRGDRNNDMLSGGAKDDFLFGGRGNDTLDGGTGGDFLVGGSGSDVYVFGLDSGADIIRGFDAEQDIIDLTARATSYDQLRIEGFDHTTFVVLGTGDRITIFGVDQDELTEDSFLF